MKVLSQCTKLVSKVKTMLEINLDFKVWQDNIFKFPTNVKQMTQLLDRDRTSAQLVEKLAQKIFTVCSVMGEKPYIQYQSNSPISEEVAMSVYKKLEYLYNYSGSGDTKKKKGKKNQEPDLQLQYREPRGTLVIMDRTLDLITPLIHDYQYQSAIFEYLPVPEDGTLDEVIKPQKSK